MYGDMRRLYGIHKTFTVQGVKSMWYDSHHPLLLICSHINIFTLASSSTIKHTVISARWYVHFWCESLVVIRMSKKDLIGIRCCLKDRQKVAFLLREAGKIGTCLEAWGAG